MKLTTEVGKDYIEVGAKVVVEGPASITITIQDEVLERVFGLEKVGFEMSVENAQELISEIEKKLNWIEGKKNIIS